MDFWKNKKNCDKKSSFMGQPCYKAECFYLEKFSKKKYSENNKGLRSTRKFLHVFSMINTYMFFFRVRQFVLAVTNFG